MIEPFNRLGSTLERVFLRLTQPARRSMVLSAAADLPRSKAQLVTENALLRQQLITLRVQRQVKRPRFTPSDRLWLVLLARRVQPWKHTLLTLRAQPETLWRRHRQGFHLFRRFKSRRRGARPNY